jgi:adenylate kinase family enzyme
MMKKIIVIGSSGAGKTHFSLRLSRALGIELIHIDKVYWRPGWVEPEKGEWKAKFADILAGESWVIDGNYTGTLEMRLAACDTVIFLDIRRTLCIWRVIRRTLRYYRRSRPDMAAGCRERLDLAFLLFVWNYPIKTKPRVIELIEAHKANIVHLKSPRAVQRFLRDLERDPVSKLSGALL